MKYEWYKKGTDLLNEIADTTLPDSMLALWYIGQMGVVVRWKDMTVCFDPVLNDLCGNDGLTQRNYPVPFEPRDFRGLDFVICSHNHADHINPATLLPLIQANPGLRIVVPEPERAGLTGCGLSGSEFTGCGLPAASLLGARAGEPIPLSRGAVLHPVAAAHETYVTDANGDQRNLGYVLELDAADASPASGSASVSGHPSGSALRLYHSGDTVVTPQLIRDVSAFSPIHIACIPVNGLDTERHSRGIIGNMDCRDAAYFASRIGADLTIPLHYDMVMGNEENPLIFAGYMRELYPGRKYHIMQLGERFIYRK